MLDIVTFQNTILTKMGFEDITEPESICEIPLLAKILACDLESIKLALGKFGENLKAFSHAVDLKHPHVKTLFDDMFADDSEFCQDISELIELAEFAREKKLTRVLSNIGGKVVSREKLCRTLLKTIDSPFNNRYHIRMLRSREERDCVRSEKKMQAIDLTTVVKKGEEVWASQPENFDSFIRWGVAYEEEINYAMKKAQRYIKLGCTGMATQIAESIKQFKNQVHEVYYGFNRITMTNAAVILAKSLGYNLTTYWLSGENDKKLYRISVPRTLFGEYNFEVDPQYVPYQTGTSSPVGFRLARDTFDYEPRVYPLYKLIHMASDHMQKIVDHLEAFPKACGKSIFDSYAIIVPGVFYPRIEHNGVYSILDTGGNKADFSTRDEAVQALDVNLIENGYLTPILLGEKDGKCFFISFWR